MTFTDSVKWHPEVEVAKWSPETVREITDFLGHEPTSFEMNALSVSPDDYAHASGNQLVTAGLTRLGDLIIGTGQAFTAARGVVGVGTSNVAWGAGQVALQGTAYYAAVTTGPSNSAGAISCTADFASGFANHAWEEWCWAIATAAPIPGTVFSTVTTGGVMLNRKVQSLGTKASGALWTLSATVTLT
jgi:hypothetical protein